MNKFMLAAANSRPAGRFGKRRQPAVQEDGPGHQPRGPGVHLDRRLCGRNRGRRLVQRQGQRCRLRGRRNAGYNYQLANNIVIGVEGDLSWMPLQRGASSSFTYKGVTANYRKVDATWLGTARGRVGYAFNNVLVYATGGIAGSDVTGQLSRAAWTVGGGLEYAFNRSWSVKAEYLYVGMEKQNATVVNAAGAVIGTQKRAADFSVARLGIDSRRFLSPLGPAPGQACSKTGLPEAIQGKAPPVRPAGPFHFTRSAARASPRGGPGEPSQRRLAQKRWMLSQASSSSSFEVA